MQMVLGSIDKNESGYLANNIKNGVFFANIRKRMCNYNVFVTFAIVVFGNMHNE